MEQKRQVKRTKLTVSLNDKSLYILRKLGYIDGFSRTKGYGFLSRLVNDLICKEFGSSKEMRENLLRLEASKLNDDIEVARKRIAEISREVNEAKIENLGGVREIEEDN